MVVEGEGGGGVGVVYMNSGAGCRSFGAIPQVQGFRVDMTIESHIQYVKHTIGHSCIHSNGLLKLKTLFLFLNCPSVVMSIAS